VILSDNHWARKADGIGSWGRSDMVYLIISFRIHELASLAVQDK